MENMEKKLSKLSDLLTGLFTSQKKTQDEDEKAKKKILRVLRGGFIIDESDMADFWGEGRGLS